VKNILETLCADVKDTEVHFKAVLSKEPMRLDIDVIKSTSHELFEAALDHQVSKEGVRVPRVEALLALKYLSCISPRRALEDKRFDVADFGRAYKQNRKLVDRKLLIDLAARADKNVREEFESFLEAVENDRPITI
jgi:hypothetical protein